MNVVITAQGHHNIRSRHRTTFQLTTEEHLSPRGDCIVGVKASHAACDLPDWLKDHLRDEGWVELLLRVERLEFRGKGQGHPDMDLSHAHDLVFRQSTFICHRTVTINTSFAAKDIPRQMVERLGSEVVVMELVISPVLEEK